RLVDLEGHLLAAEDQVRRVERRAHVGGEEGPCLLRDPGGVGRQVQLADELPAARAVLAADAGVAPALGLVLADRGRAHARAALDDVLVDARALERDEPLARVPDPMAGLREIGAVLLHRPGHALEEVALLGQADRPRVLAAVALPVAGRRLLRDEAEVRTGDERGRAGDGGGLLAGPPGGRGPDVGDGEEAPARPDQG